MRSTSLRKKKELFERNIFDNKNTLDWSLIQHGIPDFNIKPVRKKLKKDSSIFYDEMIIFNTVMRILGIFPIMKDKKGKLKTSFFSFCTLYSIAIFVTTITFSSLNIYHVFVLAEDLKLTTFDEKLVHYGTLTLVLSNILPLGTIFERWKVMNYLNLWSEFEIKYFEATGKELVIKTKGIQIVLVIFLLGFGIVLLFFITNYSITHLRSHRPTTYEFALIAGTNVYFCWLLICYGSNWCLNVWSIILASKQLLTEVKKYKTVEEFENLGQVWGQLKNLCLTFGQAVCGTYLYFLGFLFALLVINSYSAFASFQVENSIALSYSRLLFIGTIFFYISIIGDLSHRATAAVGNEFTRYLMVMTAKENDSFFREKLQWLLLSFSQNPPKISLAGYVTLNRSFNSAMYSTLISYMVIVLQFRLSGD